MTKRREIAVFAMNSTRDFGEAVAKRLRMTLAPHEEREFEDGEHKVRSLVSVRGMDVYLIESLHGDAQQSVNDKLCRVLFFIGALKDASAGRVTAVLPYLCYARKDRQTKARDPITTRYVATLFEAAGVDHVVTMDVHNLAAFQNAWRTGADHLEARTLFVKHFSRLTAAKELVVVSPDSGGMKRAEQFREAIGRTLRIPVESAFVEKHRSGGAVRGEAIVGDVAGRAVIIIDDMISTGTTVARAAEGCRKSGAAMVYVAASHGLFSSKAGEALSNPAIDKIVITNTVSPLRLDSDVVRAKLVVLDAAPLFAEAIKRMHSGGSITELLAGNS